MAKAKGIRQKHINRSLEAGKSQSNGTQAPGDAFLNIDQTDLLSIPIPVQIASGS